jgi:sugar lactone lactonase YvrE
LTALNAVALSALAFAAAATPTAGAAAFEGRFPYAITVDAADNIYTANWGSHNVSKITPDGVTTLLGVTHANPWEVPPRAIAVDRAGNVYTANSWQGSNNNEASVTKITPDGQSTPDWAPLPAGSNPMAIAIDSAGNLYTANSGSNNVSKITPDGVSTILGTTGSHPQAIAIDSAGNVYTANGPVNGPDGWSGNVSKITPDGVSTTLGVTDGSPTGIALDAAGNVYTSNEISRSLNASTTFSTVTKITPRGVTTVFGVTGRQPAGIAIDADGNLYTSNNASNNVSKITPEGVSTTIPSGGMPVGITIDSANNVYTSNLRWGTISKITPDGQSTPDWAATGSVPGGIAQECDGYGECWLATPPVLGKTAAASVAWSSSARARTVSARVTPARGVNYKITIISGGKTKSSACKKVTSGRGTKRLVRLACTAKGSKGTAAISVIATSGAAKGAAITKIYTFK